MKHRRIPAAKLKELSFTKLIPNILTLLGLCAGLTAIRFALLGNWEMAFVAIVIASLIDIVDGGMARLLDAGSSFGAELDSLADLVSFGVAPAVALYVWCMQEAGTLGWAVVLLYCVCCALRLARFNTQLESDDRPPWAYAFFTGMPTPAAAGLVFLPMMLSFQFGDTPFRHPALNGAVIVTVALLMVSRLPTYSLKRIRVPRKFVLPLLVTVCLLAAFLVGSPWATLTAIGAGYFLSLPVSYFSYRRQKRNSERRTAEAAVAEASSTPDPADTDSER